MDDTVLDVLDVLRALIAKHMQLPLEALSSESELEEIGLESVDLVTLVFSAEKQFGVDIVFEDAAGVSFSLVTVGDLAEVVRYSIRRAA